MGLKLLTRPFGHLALTSTTVTVFTSSLVALVAVTCKEAPDYIRGSLYAVAMVNVELFWWIVCNLCCDAVKQRIKQSFSRIKLQDLPLTSLSSAHLSPSRGLPVYPGAHLKEKQTLLYRISPVKMVAGLKKTQQYHKKLECLQEMMNLINHALQRVLLTWAKEPKQPSCSDKDQKSDVVYKLSSVCRI